jgi:hypothetical protein
MQKAIYVAQEMGAGLGKCKVLFKALCWPTKIIVV